jgi:hypothetical protein
MLTTAILTEVLEQLHQTRGQVERLQDLLTLLKPKTYNEHPRTSAALIRRAVTQIRRSRPKNDPALNALYPPASRFAPIDLSVQLERDTRGTISPQPLWTTIPRAQVPIIVDRVLKGLHLKKTHLALATGVAKTMIRKWETGRAYKNVPLRMQELDQLRDALESRLTPDDIKLWLKTPNENFADETPFAWMLQGRTHLITWALVRLPTPEVRQPQRKSRTKQPPTPSPESGR